MNALPLELESSSAAAPTPFLVLPFQFDNDGFDETYGAEISTILQVTDRLRLRANYSFLSMQIHTHGPVASLEEEIEGNSPSHQASIWSDVELGRNVEFGAGLRFVDTLRGSFQQIPAYEEIDARLAWRPMPDCELALVGRNLLRAHHPEFQPLFIAGRDVQVDRTVFAKVTWRF